MIRNPKLFISYSTEKFEIARFLEKELTKKGYSVFFDKESIKVGDSFPKRIEKFLRSCDGVIILISNSSIKSEWCRYEYYYSFFKGKILIPIITEQLEAGVNSPLNYFQKDINYVQLNNNTADEMHSILSKIKDKLEAVKSASLKKLTKTILLTLSIALVTYAFFQFGIKQINSYSYSREKNKLIEKIEKSNHIYTTNELKEISNKFNNDQNLAGRLFILSVDDKTSNYTRLNSTILIGQILTNFNLSQKHQIENLSWNNSTATNDQIANKVFLNGKIENVKFDSINVSNTSFNNTILSNLSFTRCSFAGAFFYPKDASILDFTGCKFYGCTIELSNFLKVNFVSKLSNDPTIVDVSMSTFFENCIFESKFEKDTPGSIDFTRIEAVKFEEINFSNCKFSGYFDKDWFKKCGFYNCTFTDVSTIADLKINNIVE